MVPLPTGAATPAGRAERTAGASVFFAVNGGYTRRMPLGFRIPDVRLPELSPFGPIFGKELRATARRRRSYVLRVVPRGLAAGAAGRLVHHLQPGVRRQRRGAGAGPAQIGQMFFAFFCVFSATAMAAMGPVLTCTAISAERLGKTLHVLLMTPMTAWQIISGKLFSRLLVALTLSA